jgi:predicted RNase H-like HicB family nuclease
MKRFVQLQAELPFALTRETGWVVATCPVLDIASQGKTPRSAERNLRAAVRLFLADSMESGTLERVLQAAGLVYIELGGRVFWVASLSKKSTAYRTLKLHVRAATPAPFHAPAIRQVKLPSVLPWIIRTDLHGQARAS